MTAPKVTIVTGASSGIGLAVSAACLEAGGQLIGNGQSAQRLGIAEGILGAGDRARMVPGDVGEVGTAERLVEAAYASFGRLDLVVLSAGIFAARPFGELSEGDLQSMISTNLLGSMRVAQAAVQQWQRRGVSGCLVFVTAAIALSPQRALPATLPITIKGGLNALTKALALELAADHIRVNAVAPGLIRTPLIADPDALAGAQPIGRVGEPEEVAEAVLYLANAPFVTGVVLPVDGGLSTGRW